METKQVWMEEIRLDKVDLLDNVRIQEDVSGLMISIREQGLLEPVGVIHDKETKRYKLIFGYRRFKAVSNLGWQKIKAMISDIEFKTEQEMERYFLITNLTENTYEKPNAVETGRRYMKLIESFKMSMSEIASVSGESVGAIKDDILLARAYIPEGYEEKIRRGRTTGRGDRKGNIPETLAKTLIAKAKNARLSKTETKALWDDAYSNGLTTKDVELISELMLRLGIPYNEAKAKMSICHPIRLSFILNKELESQLVEKYKRSITVIMEGMIKGEYPQEKYLIMKRNPNSKLRIPHAKIEALEKDIGRE